MKSKFLHFDTSTSSYIFDSNNNSKNTQNSFKTSFKLLETLYNVKKIYLKSIEMPVSFYNVRYGTDGTNIFLFTLNSVPYSIVLIEKQYQTITSLLTDLNAAVLTLSLPVTMIFSLKSSYIDLNQLIISFPTALVNFSVTPTNLAKILGFRQNSSLQTVSGNKIYFGNNNYNLNMDTALSMVIDSVPSNTNQNGRACTYKIPLSANQNSIMYVNNKTALFEQFVTIDADNFNIDTINITIYDQYGNNLNNYGSDYSFSLLFEYL